VLIGSVHVIYRNNIPHKLPFHKRNALSRHQREDQAAHAPKLMILERLPNFFPAVHLQMIYLSVFQSTEYHVPCAAMLFGTPASAIFYSRG